MDESEALAAKLLGHLGYRSIEFEPDGNVPPDFLVDGRIAVEVRRLNQHFSHGGTVQGLEQVQVPMWKNVKKLAATLGPPPLGEVSWYYSVDFRRPVEPWKTLMPKIERALMSFMGDPGRSKTTLYPADNVEIELMPAGMAHETFFVTGGQNDFDSGGFLLAELELNLRYCISEKTIKVASFRSRYTEWWLVFVDHITWGLNENDLELLREQTPIQHDWQRVILVDPRDHTRWFEL
jgi:hypothetical protein